MSVINGLPAGALPATSQVAPASTVSAAAANASRFLYDNSEIDTVYVGKNFTGLYSVMLGMGRDLEGGKAGTLSIYEKLSNNYNGGGGYTWANTDEEKKTYKMNAAATNVATTLTLLTTVGLFPGRMLKNIVTGEVFSVITVPTGTTITVVRGVGAQAMSATDGLFLMGTAVAVGQASVTSVGAPTTSFSNFFQHYVTTVQWDDIDDLTASYGGDKQKAHDEMLARKMFEHSMLLENGNIHGVKNSYTDPVTGKLVYMQDGLIQFCNQGFTADISGAALTVKNFELYLSNMSRYTKGGSNKKIILCGQNVKAHLTGLFFGANVRVQDIKSIDLSVDTIITNSGQYLLIQHPFMDADSGWENYALVVDPAYIEFVYPTGTREGIGMNGKTAAIPNTAISTYASRTTDISTYMTLAVKNRNACGAVRIA